MDVTGYINMAVGVVGIVASILTAPSLLHAVGRARRAEGDDELAKLGRGLRLFGAIFVLASFVFVLALGLAITIRSVMVEYDTPSPGVVGTLLAGALVCAAASLALKLAQSWYWMPGVVGTVGLFVAALGAGTAGTGPGFYLTVILFVIAFLIAGVIALIAESDGRTSP